MRVYKNEKIETQQLEVIVCNVCGEEISRDNFGYFEDHIHFEKQWGYFSTHDGEKHVIDICMHCYDKMLEQMKIPPLTNTDNYLVP